MKKTNASINLTINGDTPLVSIKHSTDNINDLIALILMMLNGEAYTMVLYKLQEMTKEGLVKLEDYDTIIEKLKILITMVEESTKVPAMKPSQVYGYRGES